MSTTGRAPPPDAVTVLLHKPAGLDACDAARQAVALVTPATRWEADATGIDASPSHLRNLVPLVPLEADASGLLVLSEDRRVHRRLSEDFATIEQEFVVEVAGELAPYGLHRLAGGLEHEGVRLPRCKVSWQNEVRLRFAIKGAQPGHLRAMCAQVGLEVVSIRRLRIGSVSMGKMPPGQWRCLAAGERF